MRAEGFAHGILVRFHQ